MPSSTDSASGIPIIGEILPYADGAENELLEIFRAARDCSSRSDELVEAIHDWPTKYHLSPERVNLLEPLNVTSNMRVLDVGAGTGVNARWLGEQGADVTGLEGSLDRARAAHERCRELDNVQIIAGSVHDYNDKSGFDLILCIGVLEYASAEIGGGQGQEAFLKKLRKLLRPNGQLVVAIENQLGLKYLLGYGEDHLQMPMIGIEDYPGNRTVRTFSRGVLRELLAQHGFANQQWLYPYPDYKLPTAILSESLFRRDDAELLIDQLVRVPVRDDMDARVFVTDQRRAHASFVRAGLGAEVASSFLIVAGAEKSDLVESDSLAWLFTRGRLKKWSLRRRLTESFTVSSSGFESQPAASWLTQEDPAERPFVPGATIEQQVREAWAVNETGFGVQQLKRWADHVRSAATVTSAGESPFAAAEDGLPSNWLDVGPGNFVENQDTLHYIDSEWVIDGAVDLDLALFRGLWFFAQDLISEAAPTPFGNDSVDDLALRMAAFVELDGTEDLVQRWRDAEAELQPLVRAGAVGDHRSGLLQAGQARPASRASNAVSNLAAELAASRQHEADLHQRVATMHDELEQWNERWTRLTRYLPINTARRLRSRLGGQ